MPITKYGAKDDGNVIDPNTEAPDESERLAQQQKATEAVRRDEGDVVSDR